MKLLNFYTWFYSLIRNHKGVNPRLFAPLRKFTVRMANKHLPVYLAKRRLHDGERLDNLIVSLTSFPGRINDVWKTIESIKMQTVLPSKIFLWLSKEQFPDCESSLPQSLLRQVDDLFEIRFVDGDIRSHKKYYYAFLEYPGKSIITFDDDVFYDKDVIRCLVECAKSYPNCIIANHAKKISYCDGKLLPYKDWNKDIKQFETRNLIQIGVGGVLYPPNTLDKKVLDRELFMSLTPKADDIWLNAMARLNGTPIVKSPYNKTYLGIEGNAPTLSADNLYSGENDKQIVLLREYLANNAVDVYDVDYKIDKPEWGGVIVSLTSFPARIDNVWQVIECMLHQTVLPKKILLWLSKEQFPSKESVPVSLSSMEDGIFEIRFVEGDIRSHKKWYYAFQEFENEYIFLIDDDFYYPSDIIERTLNAHIIHPDTIICNYGRKPLYNSDGSLQPYNRWRAYHTENDTDVFFGSGGGTLINPSWLHKDVMNIDLCLTLTPIADDIWLNAMCNFAGLKKHLLSYGSYLPVTNKNSSTLCSVNVEQNMNDVQLNDVISYYKNKFNLNPFNRN